MLLCCVRAMVLRIKTTFLAPMPRNEKSKLKLQLQSHLVSPIALCCSIATLQRQKPPTCSTIPRLPPPPWRQRRNTRFPAGFRILGVFLSTYSFGCTISLHEVTRRGLTNYKSTLSSFYAFTKTKNWNRKFVSQNWAIPSQGRKKKGDQKSKGFVKKSPMINGKFGFLA